jgi:hypothetical protein
MSLLDYIRHGMKKNQLNGVARSVCSDCLKGTAIMADDVHHLEKSFLDLGEIEQTYVVAKVDHLLFERGLSIGVKLEWENRRPQLRFVEGHRSRHALSQIKI